MGFAPGDEVVCVDDGPYLDYVGYGDEVWPVRGQHYTVRDVLPEQYPRPAIRLVEIVNQPRPYEDGFYEGSFGVHRFRPVRREAVEVFRQMCVSTKPLIPVD